MAISTRNCILNNPEASENSRFWASSVSPEETSLGLIQSARKWNEKLENSLIAKFSLIRSSSDPYIYILRGETVEKPTLFGICVDDGILETKKKETA